MRPLMCLQVRGPKITADREGQGPGSAQRAAVAGETEHSPTQGAAEQQSKLPSAGDTSVLRAELVIPGCFQRAVEKRGQMPFPVAS